MRKDNYNDGKPEKLLPAITNPNASLDLNSLLYERFLMSQYLKEFLEKRQLQWRKARKVASHNNKSKC